MLLLMVLFGVFIGAALTIGGEKTAKCLVTLSVNAIILFSVIILINAGIPPIAATAAGCVLIGLMTLFFQNEVNAKTKASMLAVLVVIAVMTGFVFFIFTSSDIQGFPVGQFEIRESNGYAPDIGFNMTMMQISVILMALIGAIIDTALSVASGVYEVSLNRPDLGRGELFMSGMRIGRDILGTTVNTLFFIFIAEYLTLFIQFMQMYTFAQMLNSKEFCQNVISIACSAIGCVIIIPIVSAISASMYRSKGQAESR